MEPFLSLCERPPLKPEGAPRNQAELVKRFRSAKYYSMPTVVNVSTLCSGKPKPETSLTSPPIAFQDQNMPPRKIHPSMKDEFVELTSALANRGTDESAAL